MREEPIRREEKHKEEMAEKKRIDEKIEKLNLEMHQLTEQIACEKSGGVGNNCEKYTTSTWKGGGSSVTRLDELHKDKTKTRDLLREDLTKIRESISEYKGDIENPKDKNEGGAITKQSGKTEKKENAEQDEEKIAEKEKKRKERKDKIAKDAKEKAANLSFLQRNIQLVALFIKDGVYIAAVIIAVFLFLFLIELVPVFIKIMLPFGEYEKDLLRRDKTRENEHEKEKHDYEKELEHRNEMKDHDSKLTKLVIEMMNSLDEASKTSAESVQENKEKLDTLLESPRAKMIHDKIEIYLKTVWGEKEESPSGPDNVTSYDNIGGGSGDYSFSNSSASDRKGEGSPDSESSATLVSPSSKESERHNSGTKLNTKAGRVILTIVSVIVASSLAILALIMFYDIDSAKAGLINQILSLVVTAPILYFTALGPLSLTTGGKND
uniref:DUF4407 domain-containing protein n=1 Tax=Candidatus Kentrum sp. DK TaxID=2126562 RepID=A0A450TCU3_9GAMM|nr:MAG: protein of unknown function (DUF4407) [Candidatus Kentron sp. DK]